MLKAFPDLLGCIFGELNKVIKGPEIVVWAKVGVRRMLDVVLETGLPFAT